MAYVRGYWKCDLCEARGPDGDDVPDAWSVARLKSQNSGIRFEHVLCASCSDQLELAIKNFMARG